MKKKILSILIIFTIGFALGFINSHLIYSGFWSHFFNGLKSVPFYVHIIYVFLGLFFSILIHELGHLVSFVRRGIKVRAIYALGVALVKLDRGWRIRFVPKFALMLGGIVIPDHINIHNKEDEEVFIDKVQAVLIAGPNTSLYYGVIIFIIWFIFMFFNLYLLNGFLFTFMMITSLMTLLVVKSSKLSHQGLYGDYVAHKKIKDDEVFKLVYLIQVSSLFKNDELSNKYLWPRLISQLSTFGSLYGGQKSALFLQYLHEVTFNGQIGCTKVEDKMVNMERNIPLNEEGFLLYHQLVYFYHARDNKEMVDKLLNDLNNKQFKVNPKIKMYHEKLTEHLLGIFDHTNFLNNKKNIHPNSTYFVYKPLEIYNEIETIK